jgi:hypothetical protein
MPAIERTVDSSVRLLSMMRTSVMVSPIASARAGASEDGEP